MPGGEWVSFPRAGFLSFVRSTVSCVCLQAEPCVRDCRPPSVCLYLVAWVHVTCQHCKFRKCSTTTMKDTKSVFRLGILCFMPATTSIPQQLASPAKDSWGIPAVWVSAYHSTHWKTPWCWERLRAGREGDGTMRWLDGISDSMDVSLSKLQAIRGQGSLACCGPWGREGLDTTERLNT